MKIVSLFIGLLLLSTTAFAGPKIKQIDTSRNRVVVASTKATTVGSEWIVTKKDGTQCTLKVSDKIATMAILTPVSCSNLSQLKVGQRIDKNLLAQANASSGGKVSSTGGQNWAAVREQLKGVSLIGFYSMADDVTFKSGGTEVTGVGETSWGFGAEYEHVIGESLIQGLPLGITGGATYELSREFTAQKANGQTTQFTGSKPAFSLWNLYANGEAYFTQTFSGFGGLNYPIALEKNFGGEKIKSSLGYQLGLSAELTQAFAVDGMYRWVNLKTATLSDMKLNGFILRGRYVF